MRALRSAARLGLAALLTTGLITSATTTSGAAAPAAPFPDTFDLPAGFQPEGIAIGPGPTAWFGSRVDGDIYQVDLRSGTGTVVSEGPGVGSPSVGLKSDPLGRLFVSGGTAGNARVVDTGTGEVLASYQLATGASFVNDVVLTGHAAWFTDSVRGVLYGLPLGPAGGLPDPSEVGTLPLTGDFVQGTGFGANGITATPDGQALLVVHSTSGLLYRVDPLTGAATTVDTGGASLTNGDGMLLRGRTLYVVRNRDNRVDVLSLDPSGTRATVVRTITSPRFDVPTTVARFGNRLYLPNARFTTPPTPSTPYSVTQVPAGP